MTAAEAARRLECSPRYIRLLCERGELPAWKIGRSGWRIAEASVEALRTKLSNAPDTAPELIPVRTAQRTEAQPATGAAVLPAGYRPIFPDLWGQQ